MIRPLTCQALQPLLAPHPVPCISLFLPTHRRPPDAEQDPVRFKNLFKTVRGLLHTYLNRAAPRSDHTTLLPLIKGGEWPYVGFPD
jgi:hypothetical protein